MRVFGVKIHDALERTHIFIASREDAWRALSDQTLIEQHLPYGEPGPGDGAEDAIENEDAEDSTQLRVEHAPMLKVYRLAGLSNNEVALFAGHYGVSEVSDFVNAINRGDLSPLAERPFDLKALIRVWLSDHKLGSRFEVLQRLVDLHLELISAAHAKVKVDAAKARRGIRALAGAVMLTGKAVICLARGTPSPARIDPRVLLPGWSAEEIDTVLRTGLFDDIVYSSVRFRHREIREMLSAEWLNMLLGNPGARAQVEDLFFRESYGEQIIVPRTRPTLTWLILLDDEVRGKALALAPEIATEGGDPSQLPFEVRRAMLHGIVERIAKEGEE